MMLKEQAALKDVPVRIGVEHAAPTTLSITRAIDASMLPVDIANEGDSPMHVSLPQEWARDEVRNVPLSALVADAPMFGYRRWLLPATASVTFHVPANWKELIIENPSDVPLKVKMVIVDLQKSEVKRDVYLVQEEPLVLKIGE